MTMAERAAVWHGRRDLRVDRRRPSSSPGAGTVRIAVEWCGLCGSDILEYTAGPVIIPPGNRSGDGTPLVLGHEFVGTVAATGHGVTGIAVGDVVAADTLVRCGRCHYCRSGRFNLCPELEVVGLTRDGGFAETVDVPAYMCYAVDSGVPRDVAALSEPLAVALRALRRGRVVASELPLAVIGCGGIGLLCILAARHAGAERVVAVDIAASRREAALRAGAGEATARLRAPPADRGPWVFLDCTGDVAVVESLVAAAPAGSRIVLVGVTPEPAEVPLQHVVNKELELLGSLSHDAKDFEQAIELLGDPAFDAEWLISDRIALDDLPRALERLASDGSDRLLKILVTPR